MTTEATERDLVTEVEELLANPKVFARSWYEGKQARDLLRRLVEEVKRLRGLSTDQTAIEMALRKRIKTLERDACEDAQAAANEARWQERQGEDYGSY